MIILLGSENSFCFSLDIRHLYHLLIQPEDLYNPIIKDDFSFHKKGFSKTYELKPKYFDYYDMGIVFNENNISSNYKFSGKLLVEFFYKDKLVSDATVSQIAAAWPSKTDDSKYREIALFSFAIPISKKYKKDISIRITVLEEDEVLKEYKDSIQLFVAVSAIP